MAFIPRIIYCGRGNMALDNMAIHTGFEYGVRLPYVVNHPIKFADQDWENPDKEKYVEAVKKYLPDMATVLDWERPEQEREVFEWADEISNYVERIVIIPKFRGAADCVPDRINKKQVILGYSVPTGHGKTLVKISEFKNRPVHLLGGQPHIQIMLARRMNVYSVDCNYHSRKANEYCEAWTGNFAYSQMWVQMRKLGILGDKSNLMAFSISCANVIRAWYMYGAGERFKFEEKKQYKNYVAGL